jgi:hypothetical protein
MCFLVKLRWLVCLVNLNNLFWAGLHTIIVKVSELLTFATLSVLCVDRHRVSMRSGSQSTPVFIVTFYISDPLFYSCLLLNIQFGKVYIRVSSFHFPVFLRPFWRWNWLIVKLVLVVRINLRGFLFKNFFNFSLQNFVSFHIVQTWVTSLSSQRRFLIEVLHTLVSQIEDFRSTFHCVDLLNQILKFIDVLQILLVEAHEFCLHSLNLPCQLFRFNFVFLA